MSEPWLPERGAWAERVRLSLPRALWVHAWQPGRDIANDIVRGVRHDRTILEDLTRYYGRARWARTLVRGLLWPTDGRRLFIDDEHPTIDIVRVEWVLLACEWARKAKDRRERWQRVRAVHAVDALAENSHDAAKAIERLVGWENQHGDQTETKATDREGGA